MRKIKVYEQDGKRIDERESCFSFGGEKSKARGQVFDDGQK